MCLTGKHRYYSGLFKKMLEYKNTWVEKETQFDDLIINKLPLAATPEEQIAVIQKAESQISSTYVVEFTDATDLLSKVNVKKGIFDTRLSNMVTYLATNYTSLKAFIDATNTLFVGIEIFDLQPPNTDDELKQVVILAEDMYKQAEKLHTLIEKNVDEVTDLVNDANATVEAKAKIKSLTKAAKLLFGEEFMLLPEFTFSTDQTSELQNCINDQSQLLNYQKNVEQSDYPMDDWLYGIARVREKLGSWENLAMLYEGFDLNAHSLDLLPIQLPYKEQDSWLGLSYPETYEIESDKLLYTAYNSGFNPSQSQCGLLVDEWTEIIPAKKETTGMTFHYDRPNSEPPQSMLLVTPSEFTGNWKWEDVVNSLHDTMEMIQYRAIEPDHIDQTNYAKFLPATVATVTTHPVTMALNYMAKKFEIND